MRRLRRMTTRRCLWPLVVATLLQMSCVRAFSTRADGATPGTDGGSADGASADAGRVDAGSGPRYYIATDGSDDNPGTADAPWLTWAHALGQLGPGDTLVVKDGRYGSGTPSGLPMADCRVDSKVCEGAPCPSGRAGAPIRILAEHERRAWVQSDGKKPGLWITGCSHIQVHGLRISSEDSAVPDGVATPHPVRVEGSQEIALRRLLVARTNRVVNVAGAIFANSVDGYLVEECEVYEYHHNGIHTSDSSRVTIRRNYVNGRRYADLPSGFVTTYPAGGDHGIAMQNVADALVENNVVETSALGVTVTGHPWVGDTELLDGSNDNRVLGNIALDTSAAGFFASSHCVDEDPCAQEDRIVRRARFVDNIAIDSSVGFYARGTLESVWSRNTSINANTDYRFDLLPENAALASTFAVDHCLDTGTGATGYLIQNQAQWSIDTINTFGNSGIDLPANANATNVSRIDPQLGSCRVYLPAASPLRQGVADADRIGADIVFRTVDGVVTSQRLWDPSTGAFPCGAIVDDVNGAAAYPDESCVTVHQRLNVGANGCPLP